MYYKSPSTFKLLQLLGSQYKPTQVGSGKYILHAVMLGNNLLSSRPHVLILTSTVLTLFL